MRIESLKLIRTGEVVLSLGPAAADAQAAAAALTPGEGHNQQYCQVHSRAIGGTKNVRTFFNVTF